MRRASVLCVLLLSACSLAPDYLRPEVAFPNQWETPQATAQAIPARWWEGFNSPALNALVTQALAQNTDLAASIARVAQARGDARIARASLYPQVDATASHGRRVYDSKTVTGDRNTSQAGLNVAYELDLFGANRSAREAASFTLEASAYTRDALALVVASDVTSAYVTLVTTMEQQRIAQANLKNNTDVLKIIQAQYDAGRRSALELAQQKTTVATTQATIATLTREAEISRHQLAVLCGVAPQGFAPATEAFSALAVPAIAPTLPAAVLEQRPDVRAAEAQLKAANADIGAARAAFFPSVSLGLNGSWVDGGSTGLSLAGDLLAPIFHGGALQGQLDVSTARKEELVATYRGAVLAALREASDALSAAKAADARELALAEAARQSQQAYGLAKARYTNGAIDYQTLLDTQRTLFSTEDAYALAHRERLQAVTDVYKSLGGAP
ncbi:MAG: efflux transporter outer membrane subunit [Pseudomonadota bacterium]